MNRAEPELLGLTEIAAKLGVAKNTVWRWSQRPDFPKPAARLASGPVWHTADIKTWGARLPLPVGRPKRQPPAGRS